MFRKMPGLQLSVDDVCENWDKNLAFADQYEWHRVERAGFSGGALYKQFNITI